MAAEGAPPSPAEPRSVREDGLSAIGPRVGGSTLGLMGGYPWISPYEDITLKGA